MKTVADQQQRLSASAPAEARRALIPTLASLAAALLLLLLAYAPPLRVRLDVGAAPVPIAGLHGAERAGELTYAYSTGDTTLAMPLSGAGAYEVRLRLGGPGGAPVATRLKLGGQPVDLGEVGPPRRYALLAPGALDGGLLLRLESTPITPAGERRALGPLLDWVEVHSHGAALPGRPVAALVGGVAGLVALATASLGARGAHAAAPAVGAAALLVGVVVWRRPLSDPGPLWGLGLGMLAASAPVIAWRPAHSAARLADEALARPAPRAALLTGVSLATCALFAWQVTRYSSFLIDDSYISLVYARSLVSGAGLTFNGQVVAGYSNFLWVLGAAALGALGLDLVLAVKLLGVACAAGALLLLPVMARRLPGGAPAGVVAGLLLALSTPFAVWSVAGLETSAFALLLLAGIALMTAEEERGRVRWSPLPLLGLALTRPEGFAMGAGLWGLWGLWRLLRRGRAGLSRDFLAGGAALAGGYGLFVGWHTLYYGYPMPTTVYAKTGDTARQVAEGAAYLRRYLALAPALPALALLALPLYLRRLGLGAVLVAGAAAAYTLFIVAVGGDWMPAFRFLVPALPLYALVVAGAALELPLLRGGRGRPGGVLAAGLVLALAATSVWRGDQALSAQVRATSGDVRNAERMAQQILALMRPGDSVAVLDAGAIPFYTGAPTVDMVGLNDYHIARLPGGFMAKFDNDYVLSRAPTFVQIHMAGADGVLYPINFEGTIRLYFDPEFRRWYAPTSDRPDLFRRRERPLSDAELARFFGADLSARLPASARPGEELELRLELANRGELPWHAATPSGLGAVQAVAEWRDAGGRLVGAASTRLPQALLPAGSTSLVVPIAAPEAPGHYTLSVELERQHLYRFGEAGVAPLAVPVEVGP